MQASRRTSVGRTSLLQTCRTIADYLLPAVWPHHCVMQKVRFSVCLSFRAALQQHLSMH